MKRSISTSPALSLSGSEEDFKPSPSKKQKSPKTPKSSPRKSQKADNGVWDPAKKAQFMDEIIAVGYKAADLDRIASDLGLSKRQLIDQLVPNRNGNLRSKAVKAVGTA